MSGFKSLPALLLYVFISAVFISALHANTNNNGLKKIIQEAIKDGEVRHRLVRFYDEKSNLAKEEFFGTDGSLQKERNYSYDSRGNKIAFAETRYSNGEKVEEFQLRSAEYEYNDEGNIIREYAFNADDEKYLKYEYLYDDDGNKSLQVWYNRDGSVFQRSVYSYNDSKTLIDILGFGETLIKRIAVNKDSRGNKILETTTLPDNTETDRTEYTYNDNNNLVEKIIYKNGIQIRKEISEYDDSGKLVYTKTNETEFRNLETVLSYKYDSLGREIEHFLESEFDSGKKMITRTRFEYYN